MAVLTYIWKPKVTKLPLYEYRDLWAEESGPTNASNSEWSMGNGATGIIGLPFDDGWEVVGLGFQADIYAATASITVDLMNYTAGSNLPIHTLASISLANSTDGTGATNNAIKYEALPAPVPIPSGAAVGFFTRAVSGNISDARAYARFRRQIGEYVSDVGA